MTQSAYALMWDVGTIRDDPEWTFSVLMQFWPRKQIDRLAHTLSADDHPSPPSCQWIKPQRGHKVSQTDCLINLCLQSALLVFITIIYWICRQTNRLSLCQLTCSCWVAAPLQNAQVDFKERLAAVLCSSVCFWDEERILPQDRGGVLELCPHWDECHSKQHNRGGRVSTSRWLCCAEA